MGTMNKSENTYDKFQVQSVILSDYLVTKMD